MTYEEARIWLQDHFNPIPKETKQDEVIELAIKALKILDYIQAELEARQVLNVMIRPRNSFKTYSAGYQRALKDMQDFINKKMDEIE